MQIASSCGLGLLAWLCPHLILCCVLCIACLPVLLLLLLLGCLAALYASVSPLLQVEHHSCNQVLCLCWQSGVMQDVASTEHVCGV